MAGFHHIYTCDHSLCLVSGNTSDFVRILLFYVFAGYGTNNASMRIILACHNLLFYVVALSLFMACTCSPILSSGITLSLLSHCGLN